MSGKVAPPDRLIAEVAARRRGVASIAQLRRLGVTDDAVRSRVLAGRLHRVHRGVYAVGHHGLSARQVNEEPELVAATLAAVTQAGRSSEP